MSNENNSRLHRFAKWALGALAVVVLYVLSSGPVIAVACLLREATHRDGFYFVFWVYFPLFAFGNDNILIYYVEWWMRFFGAIGPG